MSVEEFSASVKNNEPPSGIKLTLQALWYDRKGDWQESHRIAQEIETTDGSWVHAYLHRKEGDDSNASYWYRKAGKHFPAASLDEEWRQIVRALL